MHSGPPPECVCFVGVFPRPHFVDFFFLSIFKVSKQCFPKAEMNKIQTLSLRLQRPPLTARDFQSSHHHSFIDSSGSASIPSSLIHKLRTAILIALRTVEVFNGFLPDRGKGVLSLPRVGLKFSPQKRHVFFFPVKRLESVRMQSRRRVCVQRAESLRRQLSKILTEKPSQICESMLT